MSAKIVLDPVSSTSGTGGSPSGTGKPPFTRSSNGNLLTTINGRIYEVELIRTKNNVHTRITQDMLNDPSNRSMQAVAEKICSFMQANQATLLTGDSASITLQVSKGGKAEITHLSKDGVDADKTGIDSLNKTPTPPALELFKACIANFGKEPIQTKPAPSKSEKRIEKSSMKTPEISSTSKTSKKAPQLENVPLSFARALLGKYSTPGEAIDDLTNQLIDTNQSAFVNPGIGKERGKLKETVRKNINKCSSPEKKCALLLRYLASTQLLSQAWNFQSRLDPIADCTAYTGILTSLRNEQEQIKWVDFTDPDYRFTLTGKELSILLDKPKISEQELFKILRYRAFYWVQHMDKGANLGDFVDACAKAVNGFKGIRFIQIGDDHLLFPCGTEVRKTEANSSNTLVISH